MDESILVVLFKKKIIIIFLYIQYNVEKKRTDTSEKENEKQISEFKYLCSSELHIGNIVDCPKPNVPELLELRINEYPTRGVIYCNCGA